VIAPGAALQRLLWMAGEPVPPDLRIAALAVELAASHRMTAGLCDDPFLARLADEAEAQARELMQWCGVHCDLPPEALCRPLPM